MATKTNHLPLLRTKLHRPQIPSDYLERPQLISRLEKSVSQPLILVSAPAGYGKSTVVGHWLEGCERPSAWVSLDESDADLQRFLFYFASAVRQLFPDALGDTLTLIEAPALPPVPVLAATLSNELDDIEHDFVVALDDLHIIEESAIFGFLETLFIQPPRPLQLVLIGRHDLPLPIATWRAQGKLTELRMADLRFTAGESEAYLQGAAPLDIGTSALETLLQKTEGWVTALRLAVLAVQGNEVEGPAKEAGNTPYVMDYLIGEVLNRQPPAVRDLLLRTAILDRFCAPLCTELTVPVITANKADVDCASFIDWLQKKNLFVIGLDDDKQWFRFHHLFRALLRDRLIQEMSHEKIASLYTRASKWCAEQGLIEESIGYAIKAGDYERAADIVEQHRDAEFEANRWYVVRKWLALLPEGIKRERPCILLTEARVFLKTYLLRDIPPTINRAKALMNARSAQSLDEGELRYFQGIVQFWQGDGPGSQRYLDQALALVPEDSTGFVRAQVELWVGLAGLMNGQKDAVLGRLREWRASRQLRTGLVWERQQFGMTAIHLLGGELEAAFREGRRLLDDAKQTGKTFIEAWANFLLGAAAFHRNDLTRACRHFNRGVDNRYVANTRAALDSMAGLAVAYELEGQQDAADQAIGLAHDYAEWTGDSVIVDAVFSCEARIALLRGDLEAAAKWQQRFGVSSPAPGLLFFLDNASITECRVLAALGTEACLSAAADKLQRLRKETESIHFTCQTIEIAVLQAVVAHLWGRPPQALDLLRQAVALAEPGGWIRPFVEIGAPMRDMMKSLLPTGEAPGFFVDRLLSVLSAQPSSGSASDTTPSTSAGNGASPGPNKNLTRREREIIHHVADGLCNKDIAAELNLSVNTVKKHLYNTYQKLGVKSRVTALTQARNLGILGDRSSIDQQRDGGDTLAHRHLTLISK